MASPDARFEFKKYIGSALRNDSKRVHDLSIADPFDATFLEGYVALSEGILVQAEDGIRDSPE